MIYQLSVGRELASSGTALNFRAGVDDAGAGTYLDGSGPEIRKVPTLC